MCLVTKAFPENSTVASGLQGGGKRTGLMQLRVPPCRARVRQDPAGCPHSCFWKPTSGLGPCDHAPVLQRAIIHEEPHVNGGKVAVFFSTPDRKRYPGRISALCRHQSNTKNASSEQALTHSPKAVDRQCNELEEAGEHASSTLSPTDGLVSPALSFSAPQEQHPFAVISSPPLLYYKSDTQIKCPTLILSSGDLCQMQPAAMDTVLWTWQLPGR